MFYRKLLRKRSRSTQENSCIVASFLVKFTCWVYNSIKKKKLQHRCFSLNFSRNFPEHLFRRTPPNVCYWLGSIPVKSNTHFCSSKQRWNALVHDSCFSNSISFTIKIFLQELPILRHRYIIVNQAGIVLVSSFWIILKSEFTNFFVCVCSYYKLLESLLLHFDIRNGTHTRCLEDVQEFSGSFQYE